MLARLDWAPALTRDGLTGTDLLAVHTRGGRTMIEVQVKSIRKAGNSGGWPVGLQSQSPAVHDREGFTLVGKPASPLQRIRRFVVPRDHVAAAAWIVQLQ